LERFRVITAGTAEDGIKILGEKHIDVVVSDIMLPGMRGTDLLALIKKDSPEIPVILITGFSGKITPQQAIAIGADGYFAKPFHNKDLAFTLRSVLQQYERNGGRRRANAVS